MRTANRCACGRRTWLAPALGACDVGCDRARREPRCRHVPESAASAPGHVPDRLGPRAREPEQQRTENEPDDGGRQQKEIEQHRIPEQGMNVTGHGGLDQREAPREQPERDLADRREAHGVVRDRARAVDDEANEARRDQDEADKTGEKPEHRRDTAEPACALWKLPLLRKVEMTAVATPRAARASWACAGGPSPGGASAGLVRSVALSPRGG